MTNEQEHFSIRETDLVHPDDQRKRLPPPPYEVYEIPHYENISNMSITILWAAGSWSILLLNIAQCLLNIRDMVNEHYNPLLHCFSSLVIVSTIGGLIAIHQFIYKGNQKWTRRT